MLDRLLKLEEQLVRLEALLLVVFVLLMLGLATYNVFYRNVLVPIQVSMITDDSAPVPEVTTAEVPDEPAEEQSSDDPSAGFGGGFGDEDPSAGFGGGFGEEDPSAGFGGGFGEDSEGGFEGGEGTEDVSGGFGGDFGGGSGDGLGGEPAGEEGSFGTGKGPQPDAEPADDGSGGFGGDFGGAPEPTEKPAEPEAAAGGFGGDFGGGDDDSAGFGGDFAGESEESGFGGDFEQAAEPATEEAAVADAPPAEPKEVPAFAKFVDAVKIEWIDVLLRQLVLIVGFLGAMLATRRRKHITVDALSKVLPENVLGWVKVFTNVLSLVVCVVLAQAGADLVKISLEYPKELMSWAEEWHFQLAFPIGFGMLALHFIIRVIESVAYASGKVEPPEDYFTGGAV